MRLEELIEKLEKFPADTEVCIVDWRKNLHHACIEPQSYGIEPKFKVEFIEGNVNIPFVALAFENDDYRDDGLPDFGSSICASIEHYSS